ncbi:hypothetical protein [Xanthobacter sp. YC-JY1]|uniref:capsid assembly protein n=1 Tax=Xanthobacter sp. YC-JY1 TaxID=2419844 RepID=UPI001F2B09FF|nr:hypothetical protein [Xanthobacter sp. YC-JY1]UJX45762.1 hypothetical protein D7006_14305 [Xanthobacter sp. YC-JY1]
MVERVTVTADPTGSEAPKPDAQAPATGTPAAPGQPEGTSPNLEKALADTKAELTRAQQRLAELEKGKEPDPAATPEGNKPAETPKPDAQQEAAQQVVAKAGFDMTPFNEEFATTGDVAPENREKIAEGLKAVLGEDARKVIDDYIEGRKVIAKTQEAELYAAGGGAETYPAMIAWAKTALTPQEAKQFDASVTSGDHNAALFAIKGLHSRFVAANGKEPTLINAGAPSAPVGGFASQAELTAAVGDPRYSKDPVYRKQVEERLKKTDYRFST